MTRKGTGQQSSETEKEAKPTEEAGVVEKSSEETAEESVIDEEEEKPTTETSEGAKKPDENETPEKVVPEKIHPGEKKEMATIIIDEARTDTEQQDVFITDPSDGNPFLIQRGKQVDVPIGVLNNLKESVQEKLVRDKETGEEKWKKVPRFSFTVIKEYTK